MAKSKNGYNKKLSYISVPSQIINSLSSSSLQYLLVSPKKSSTNSYKFFSFSNVCRSPKLWFIAVFLFALFGMVRLGFGIDRLVPISRYPCSTMELQAFISNGYRNSHLGSASNRGKYDMEGNIISDGYGKSHMGFASNSDKYVKEGNISNGYRKSHLGFALNNEKIDIEGNVSNGVRQSHRLISNLYLESEVGNGINKFWKQPDGLGYRPCLNFSVEYRKESLGIVNVRRKYLMVVVAGGMNQQRNQIVDAVVIARILGAALVIPILQVNVIWGDESEFSDIFDLEHFKRVLANDVRIVSSLPSTHIMTRPVEEKLTPLHASPDWIRERYCRRLRRDGVLLLRGLDSRLSKDLPSDLQKLRCKVAFHALRFSPSILELGNKISDRMRNKGPYLALHLRMEKDVWVRTGCLPGMSRKYDEIVNKERKERPKLLTGRSNMTYHDRKLAGLCPLNALDVTRLLKALGAPKSARIYWAGGQPLGGNDALLPLTQEFPHFYSKENLTLPGELDPLTKKASLMAAIDYIVSEKSDVFMPSHGGNMGHAIQGIRAYTGHKKYITPNKRQMLPYFLNSSLPEAEFNNIIKELHRNSLGQPELRISKVGRDVTKYPIPECMCTDMNTHSVL